ncbi:MTH1187 family thiamine-binding protein [Anaerobacillus sp. HL2]|nr:MTH1187 family thiamine-binding protein [Anaerobacillus sp. HL2]
MAIVDITIIPIGTNDASVSQYVAAIHELLATYQDKVEYKLTPMSTIIEEKLHYYLRLSKNYMKYLLKGVKRVATNIRIDDRRDK